MSEKRLINIDELSEYLSTPVGTLYQWISQKRIPYVKLGRSVRFDLEEINQWLKENSHAPTLLTCHYNVCIITL